MSVNFELSQLTLLITSIATGVTASGTTQATALALPSLTNVITTCAAGAGTILPVSAIGTKVVVLNRAANALLVYPPTSQAIEANALNVATSIVAGGVNTFIFLGSNQWYVI